MYNILKWLDEVKDPDTQVIIQPGTPQSAGNFNNMERGILDAYIAGTLAAITAEQQGVQLEVEEKELTLTNSLAYPFNNSKTTVALTKPRISKDYTIDVEVKAHTGNVGNVIISDKLVNGFKVEFDGSGTSVTVILRIKGGL